MEYAVYKGDTFICLGTDIECANYMGIKLETFNYYLTPTYKNKLAKRKSKKGSNSTEVIILED